MNPEIEKKMAEVREGIAGLYKKWVEAGSVCVADGGLCFAPSCSVCFAEHVYKLPLPIGGGVCKECKGEKVVGIPDFIGSNGICTMHYCLACKGTGSLPVKTITVEQAIREKISDG